MRHIELKRSSAIVTDFDLYDLLLKGDKSKDVQLSITDKVRGTVETQSDAGKADKLAEAIAVDNPLTRMAWEVTLKAGEERVIKYRYKVWLRV